MKHLNNYKRIYLVTLLSLLSIFCFQITDLNYKNVSLTHPSGKTEKVKFPFFKNSGEVGLHTINGTIATGLFSAKRVRIIPDDEIISIQINNQNIDLNKISHHAKKDYRIGFSYDLSQFLTKEENAIQIKYKDFGGQGGIVFGQDERDSRTQFILIIVALLLIWLLFEILQKTKLRLSFKVILLAAFAIRLIYFGVTPQDVRDHDLGDHYYYVKYMSENWLPPSVEKAVGGAFFHPPLFYYTGAIVHKIAQWISPLNNLVSYRLVQLLETFYSMGFVLFGLLIIELLFAKYRKPIKSKAPFLSATYWKQVWKGDVITWVTGVLFAFWPVAIIHSARIGNDPLLYFLFAASLYFIYKWFYFEKNKDLYTGTILAAYAILTKANGAILVAVLLVLALYKAYTTNSWRYYFKLSRVPSAILILALGITFAPGIILKLEGKRDKLYVDDIAGLSKANLVGNTASNYLWFDIKIFITQPFTSPFDDRLGRQYFWNYLGKTGLFGEFNYKQLLCRNTAVILSLIAFCMFIYTLLGLYNMRRFDFENLLPLILSFLFLWGGVTYMRMTFPANIDFRYILPILIPFVSFFGLSILTYERQRRFKLVAIGLILTGLFTLNSILFILGLI